MSAECLALRVWLQEDAMELKVGDRVVYFKYAGDPMETPDGKKWVVLRQDDILCKA